MFFTTVSLMFLIKLRWPMKKNIYEYTNSNELIVFLKYKPMGMYKSSPRSDLAVWIRLHDVTYSSCSLGGFKNRIPSGEQFQKMCDFGERIH